MADPERLWLFFPNFSESSPYQNSLAAGLTRHGYTVRPGTIEQATGAAVFHLGWEQPVYVAATTEGEASALTAAFLSALEAFRASGGLFVWTMHNLAPHEERFPAVNATMQRELARRADVVHVHNRTGAAHATGLGVAAHAIVLSRHPRYSDAYPDDVDDRAARRYLGLDRADIVFSFFGAIRGYKGIPRLLRAFEAASAERPNLRLVVAGRSRQPNAARVQIPEPRLRILSRDIADAEIQYVIRAADCVVLPYEAILTSGALTLAQGFGRPAIVPDLPSMAEEVTDGVNGFLYAAGSDDALTSVLGRAADAVALNARPDARRRPRHRRAPLVRRTRGHARWRRRRAHADAKGGVDR